MNACNERCGWCGRCDDGLRESPPYEVALCDYCGGPIQYPLSLAGVGITCSRACMNKLERQYVKRMEPRHRHA